MIDNILEDDHFIVLRIDVSQFEEAQHELLEPLRSPEIYADIPPQGSGIPLSELLGYIRLLKDTVAVARAIARRVIAWRQQRRQNGKPIGIRISRPGKAPLNLVVATDEEITVYITDGREQQESRAAH